MWLVLIALALVSATVRLQTVSQKQSIVHDEAISLMAAAGKLNAFLKARRDLTNRWVSGRKWHNYIEISKPWDFKGVQRGLVKRDIHPPLYFWLLHIAGIVGGGLTARTGGILNTLLHMLGMLSMFGLVKRTTGHPAWALLAVAVWSFGATALGTTYVARQYELLGVLGITSAWLLVQLLLAHERHWLWAALLALTLGAALLTHSHGLLLLATVMLAGALALTERVVRRRRSTLDPIRPLGPVLALAAAPLATVLGLLAHPSLLDELANLRGRGQPRSARGFDERWSQVASTLTETFDQPRLGKHHATAVIVVFILLCLVPLMLVLVRFLRTRATEPTARFAGALVVLLFLVVVASGTFGSYLGFVSPRHTMGARYLALVWPFLAISLSYAGWLAVPRLAPLVTPPVIALLVVLGWSWRASSSDLCELRAHYAPTLQLATTVVIDSTARGHLGQLLLHIRSDAQVFVAHGKAIQTEAKKVVEKLERSNSAAFVHMGGYGVSARHGASLFALAEAAQMRLKQGQLAGLLEPETDLVVLLVGRGDLRKLLRDPDMTALHEAGGSVGPAPRRGASSWLLHGGRVIDEYHAKGARLTRAGSAAGKAQVPFSLECSERGCEAALGTARLTTDGKGLWVMVWSVSKAKLLLSTRLVANAEAKNPGDTKLGTRGGDKNR